MSCTPRPEAGDPTRADAGVRDAERRGVEGTAEVRRVAEGQA